MLNLRTLFALAALALSAIAAPVHARDAAPGEQSGVIEWGVYVDPDGCLHWWADGGVEGVMVSRLDPHTGKPVCLKRNTCLVGDADTFFATDSARLTAPARRNLEKVFMQDDVFGYAVYGHTDSRASRAYNQRLSDRRAASVADFGRRLGAVIERQAGFGEDRPIASNTTAAGRKQNRRVEVICYRW